VLLINGSEGSALEATDRGLLYGDGLFETIAVIDGDMPLWDRHLRRLQHGCRRLGFACPDEVLLRPEAETLVAGTPRCVLKILVTRGSGGEAYRPPAEPSPTRLLQRRSWPAYPESFWRDGIRSRLCQTRLAVGSPVAGLKHLNRLEQVLARQEWSDPQIPEGLTLDDEGLVVEGTMTNLFAQQDGRLLTPPVERCGVAGVMRSLVMEMAAEVGLAVEQRQLTPADIGQAEGLFLTNAVIGIWPVRDLEGSSYKVTDETRRLQDILAGIIGNRP
jgi:4-amino-4-deoxychorismate lyase